MIIKSKISLFVHIPLILAISVLPFLTGNIILGLIPFLPFSYGYLKWIVIIYRTFILDEEGCTVRFWKFEKTYKWSELQTKQIETKGNYLIRNLPYNTVVVFYKKRSRKPRWVQPYEWCSLHPLSYIFIHFKSESKDASFRIYEADKELLLGKLEEWGVQLEEVDTIRY